MYIDRKYSRQQTSVSRTLELALRRERGHVIDASSFPPRAGTNSQVRDGTNDILFVI